MPIYTKKGDKGRTSLGSGVKRWKDDIRVNAYGTVDELNSFLGVVKADLLDANKNYANYLIKIIEEIQDDLFSIGAYLSNPANSDLVKHLPERTSKFEKDIDHMTKSLPELTNFILPGGGKSGALFQYGRTVARRAERNLVSLIKKEKVNEDVVKYINRLSDLLFTMSRYTNYKERKKETIWKRR